MEHFAKDYHGQTTLHPLGLAALVVLGLLIFLLPRRYAVWPMLIMACFMAQAQRVVIFTLDFNMLRMMVMLGWMRLLFRSEVPRLTINRLDLLLILWTTVRTLAVVAQGWGSAIIILQLGRAFDAIGMYFLFRCLIRDWADVRSAIWAATCVSIPVAMAFVYEAMTARNLFAVFGGLPQITPMRGERLRCQGAFAHPILAGCFWASLLPLIAAQLRQRSGRVVVVASLLGIVLIVVACASSTPVMTVLLCMVGALAFFIRHHMRVVRWSLVLLLFGLALAMNKPVWHLIARVHVVSGSTSWHRYKLIDAAIAHWDEWFVMGSKIGSDHWGAGLYDVTNDYIVQALQGGILQLLLFVALIVVAFQAVGRLWRGVERDGDKLWLAWTMGVSLFAHALNFIAVTYFGQIILVWFLLLAMIASLSAARAPARARSRVRKPVVAPAPPSGSQPPPFPSTAPVVSS